MDDDIKKGLLKFTAFMIGLIIVILYIKSM